jgi:hypothetical protein
MTSSHHASEPSEDRSLSPYTGYSRVHWERTADLLLAAAHRYASPSHALVIPPGIRSKYGSRSDGLEGFARTFLIAACQVAGQDGQDPHHYLDFYVRGLTAGTNPQSPDHWPGTEEVQQAKVEAGGLALGLHLTRRWLWDRLPAETQERIIAWFSTIVGAQYPPINWVWFKLLAQAFLRSVGGPWSPEDVAGTLDLARGFFRPDGWCCDGEERAYDHYSGWVLQTAPLMWADIVGPQLCPPELRETFADRLAAFLPTAVRLVGADGSPLIQGRTLTYRWAAAAPFWVAAWAGVDTLSPGLLRRAASGMLRHFVDRGAPTHAGLLAVGWHAEWPDIAQAYTGSGSPYWVANGMLGLALPGSHPVWRAIEEPLPVERHDDLSIADSPGWLISGTHTDGVVRVINHGTDHSVSGDLRSDSPLYARLGYSTATVPPLIGPTVASPMDNSVVLFDTAGRASSRNGFQRIDLRKTDTAAVGVSRSRVHWVRIEDDTSDDHGSGRAGRVTLGPHITVASAIRGPIEIRAARIDPTPDATNQRSRLRFGGWPLASAHPMELTVESPGGRESSPSSDFLSIAAASITHPDRTEAALVSTIVGVVGLEHCGIERQDGSSPLGRYVAIPWVQTPEPAEPDRVYVAQVVLSGRRKEPPVQVCIEADDTGDRIEVAWPDGASTELVLPRNRSDST